MKTKLLLLASIVVLFSGCAAIPAGVLIAAGEVDRSSYSTPEYPSINNQVSVTKYQFFPDAKEMTMLCYDALTARFGAIDRSKVKMAHERSFGSGKSTCTASLN